MSLLIRSLNNYDFLCHVLIFHFHVVYNDMRSVILIFTPKLSVHHCLSLLKMEQERIIKLCKNVCDPVNLCELQKRSPCKIVQSNLSESFVQPDAVN